MAQPKPPVAAPGGPPPAAKPAAKIKPNKKRAPKKRQPAKKAKRPTPDEVIELRALDAKRRADEQRVEDWEREQKLRADYEKEKADLAPWVGWEEYQAAKTNEHRIKSIGIIGAIMRGEKRTEIRRKFRISAHKLNAILNSETVDNLLAYSLGYIYSFQTACVNAILHRLREDHDGNLAMALLDKLGAFNRAPKLIQTSGAADPDAKGQNVEDVIGVLFAKGDSVQTRQALAKISELVIDGFKAQAPK